MEDRAAPAGGTRGGTILIAVAATLLLLTAAGLLLARVVAPGDGASTAHQRSAWRGAGLEITATDGTTALRAGDVVVAVDGRALAARRGPAGLLPAEEDATSPRTGSDATYRVVRDGAEVDVAIRWTRPGLGEVVAGGRGSLGLSVVLGAVGAYVFVRRPREPATRALLLFAGTTALGAVAMVVLPSPVDLAAGRWWFSAAMAAPVLAQAALLHTALVFPRPPAGIARRPWLLVAVWVGPLAIHLVRVAVELPGTTGGLERSWIWLSPHVIVEPVYAAAAIGVVAVRAARSEDPHVRRSLRWLAAFLVGAGALYLALWAVPETVLGRSLLPTDLAGVLFLPFPFIVAAAVLRYRLYDIQPVLNRFLVWLSLTTCVVAAYALVVGFLGSTFQRGGSFAAGLVATGVVAVLFHPVRAHLQRAVDQLMYGDRTDPYSVLSRLGERLDATANPDDVLQTLATTVGETLRLPYVAVVLEAADADQPVAVHGAPAERTTSLPLTHAGEAMGALVVAPRRGEELGRRDLDLLGDLARHAGASVRAVHLTADLRRSRERLVVALEDERRRIRRDLHDGVGPALAGIRMKAAGARNLLGADPEATRRLLAEVEADAQAAIGEVRRVVHGLRPPVLDQLGLVGALEQHAAGLGPGLLATVEATAVPAQHPLPAAVEVAAYRIANEAITNVVHHAGADRCEVRLRVDDGQLVVEVTDDGAGLPERYRAGVGLQSMRERAEELGGTTSVAVGPGGRGTSVTARLPMVST